MSAVHKRANAERARIRRDYPHQVAMVDDMCCMENFEAILEFCRRFDVRPKTTWVMAIWEDGTQVKLRLHCFAKAEDAAVFATHFEGEPFDPARDRAKGRLGGAWMRRGSYQPITRYGPLRMPKFFIDNP